MKWLKPLQCGTPSTLLLIKSSVYITIEHKKKRCVHFINLSTGVPTQCVDVFFKADPEMVSKQSTGESMKTIER